VRVPAGCLTTFLTLVLAACAAAQPPPVATPAAEAPAAPLTPATALARVLASPDLDGAPPGADPAAKATVVIVFASWCTYCRAALAQLGELRGEHAGLRVIGVNAREHEEYDARGDAAAVRAYVADHAPWLRVVPADDALFGALGRPPRIPTTFVYDGAGALVQTYDRSERPPPAKAELAALLARLGA
jgi:thiol-disulfide isomerase/thioredoxin